MELAEVSSYRVRNYKSVVDSGKIDLNSTAIILGPNSAGKTNVVEPLLLLKQSIEQAGTNLSLNGDRVKLGSFGDIVHNHELDKNIGFKFYFNYNSEPREPDRPLECPVCNKNYKEEGWYRKHIRNKHKEFWKNEGEELEKYEEYPPKEPFIELVYGQSEAKDSGNIKEINIGYPPSVGALYLSEISLGINTEELSLSATDLHGEKVINVSFETEKYGRIDFQNIRDMGEVVGEVLSTLIDSNHRRFIKYSQNQPYIPDDRVFELSNSPEKLDDVFKRMQTGEELQKDSNGEGFAEYRDLAIGVVHRLASIADRTRTMTGQIEQILEDVSHIGPLRRSPQRIYFASGTNSQESYSRGVNLEDRIFRKADQSKILKETNQWLQKTGFDCKVSVEKVEVGDIHQLKVEENGISVNLADSGFGLSQTLPILIECIYNTDAEMMERNQSGFWRSQFLPPQSVTIIEEPEIHLNPRIESAIADFFVEMNSERVGMIIETHSEHILNRIQRRIAEGSIQSEDVSVYFISKSGLESDVREIEIGPDGAFDEWPDGFFQEDFDDAIAMLKQNVTKEE